MAAVVLEHDRAARVRHPHGALRTALLVVALAVLGLALLEGRTSALQSRYLTALAAQLRFQPAPGPSPLIRFPDDGPYDLRLGYARLPAFVERLHAAGYRIESQARISTRLARLIDVGLFAPYREKIQAGLVLLDRNDREIFSARYPRRVYRRFTDIPPLVVDTLLFIENRELLDPDHPRRNPAVEWDRLGRAVLDKAQQVVVPGKKVVGGSTLATQIEKFRHSPGGQTRTAADKLRQIASASLRSYLDGPETLQSRQRIVRDYLNSVPLSAQAGLGEISGLGDGLDAWYGADFVSVNQLLRGNDPAEREARARAYREVLSLMIAQRRPSDFLAGGHAALQNLTDTYLHLLAEAGVISTSLRDAARALDLQRRSWAPRQEADSFSARKSANVVRSRLLTLLEVPRFYDLDRLDLTVRSTIDAPVQQAVTNTLRHLREPEFVQAAGLNAFRLLENKDPTKVIYSFSLYERVGGYNLLRVQTDSFDQPFNINEGVKLDLGSTAKLRTLVHYLEIVASLHAQYAKLDDAALRAVDVHPRDHLSQFVIDQLLAGKDRSLPALLNAALARRYSASPGERFFTGGGVHTFGNFDHDDDTRVLSVRDALRDSVNLVFVRLMRDIVYHYLYRPGSTARVLEDVDDPQRLIYLQRFADREGSQFMRRFHNKYRGKDATGALGLLAQSVRPTPVRLATVFRSVRPSAGIAEFSGFLRTHLSGSALSDAAIQRLFDQYTPEHYSLTDRGYLAQIHPLELWLVEYLSRHPAATQSEVIAASAGERQEVYRWLFKTHNKNAQDIRIRSLLEVEAFLEIHRAWKRLGYPFDSLVPSYATAIGSSADRPAALAELMGILVNDGLHFPSIRVEELHFAADTPYETVMRRGPGAGERVLAPEIAAAVRQAVIAVVEGGTAQRVRGTFVRADGSVIAVGGKTGTGDHRYDTFGAGGRLLESRVVNRAATFVFLLGDRFFGNVTAYVPGPEAAQYKFTSALPVQVLKLLGPQLIPLISDSTPVTTVAGQELRAGIAQPTSPIP